MIYTVYLNQSRELIAYFEGETISAKHEAITGLSRHIMFLEDFDGEFEIEEGVAKTFTPEEVTAMESEAQDRANKAAHVADLHAVHEKTFEENATVRGNRFQWGMGANGAGNGNRGWVVQADCTLFKLVSLLRFSATL